MSMDCLITLQPEFGFMGLHASQTHNFQEETQLYCMPHAPSICYPLLGLLPTGTYLMLYEHDNERKGSRGEEVV